MKKLLTLLSLSFSFSLVKADYWTQKANFPGDNRRVAFSFSISDKGYIGGGSVSNGLATAHFWEYDQPTNVWTQKADYGGGAGGGSASFSVGNKGYVTAGGNSAGLNQDLWEYDPAFNTWTQKANFGGSARSGAVGFSLSIKGYVGTGINSSGGYQDLWEYDPALNSWVQKSSLPGSARWVATSFSIGMKGYITGGYFNNSYLNDLWEYDPVTDSWTQKTNLPGVRGRSAGFSIGNTGYIGCGDAGSPLNDFLQYDPVTNAWTPKTNFPGLPRDGMAFFSINCKGYIGMGGQDAFPLFTDFWEYTPDSACATGIDEFQVSSRFKRDEFQVSPNPVSQYAVISWQSSEKKINIVVTDVNGKKVYEAQLQPPTSSEGHEGLLRRVHSDNFQLPTSNFSKGIYFVELHDGKQKAVKKFLKE